MVNKYKSEWPELATDQYQLCQQREALPGCLSSLFGITEYKQIDKKRRSL